MNSPTIDVTKALIAKLQYLPPEQQQTLLDFAEFLVHKNPQPQVIQQRVLGLYQGQIWMSEDFNNLNIFAF
ncbi:MAG: DUF2281 domain-containing protein [Gloeotrichia echinulata DEX184]|nr:DUF2281 domain-containing protein [Gloeotrichia echinulata DEX184]